MRSQRILRELLIVLQQGSICQIWNIIKCSQTDSDILNGL